MTAIDGSNERLVGDPIRGRHTLLSVLPSVALHGAIAAAVWFGFTQRPEEVRPAVTFIALAPAVAPAPPEPLPPTGMRLPQPEPETAPQPPLDFAPPALPKLESFPFDPNATREAPPPEPEAVPIEKAKELEKQKAAKAKPTAKPKPKEAPKKAATPKPAVPPVAAESKATENPPPVAAKIPPAKAASANAAQSAAIGDAPVRVTNPNYAGACPISYPERARRRSQEGTVVIHALIGIDGKPIEVKVAQSSGHSLLDEAAQEAISHCAFVPQQVGGRAVKAIVEIPIPFRLI
jgi:protein TonB